MQYNLTHRGTIIATFDTTDMDPIEAVELRRINGAYFKIEQAEPDRLPELNGRSNLEGVSGWIPPYLRQSAPAPVHARRGRKHSTRATSWL